jgi:AbrB family looped-hinge helix DNA binding protein
MTLPKEIRDRLHLKPGDRLDVFVEDRRIILTSATLSIDDLARVLPRAKRARTLDQMEAAIRRRAAKSP